MRKILVCMVLPIFLLGMTACGGTEVDKQLNLAANAIEDDDYEKVQVICDQVMKKYWSELTLENKCDLAACYAMLYGELDTNEDANLAALKKCYKAAMKENPKETRKYFNDMDEEAHDAIKLLIELDEMGEEFDEMLQDWDF